MPTSPFQELTVYLVAEQLCDLVWDIVRGWEPIARDTVGKQLIRAADSIGANIAEGTGRGSFADNKRFVRIARGSLYETKHWLRRAFRRRLLTQEQINQLQPLVDRLGPLVNGYLRSIGRGSPCPDEGQRTKDEGRMP
jgi:four helix bundle protein